MTPMARWGTLPLLGAPVCAWALGLGEIELQSALNQPFRAEIELVSATPDELEGLSIAVPPLATFERYGLDRPGFLSSLTFNVRQDGAGNAFVAVSSREPIGEPFVTMLIEATWPRGRLLREYTVLLDPPMFLDDADAPVPVQAPRSGPDAPAAAGGSIERQSRPAAAASPAAPPQVRPAQALPASGNYGPVQRAETLWGIASRFLPADVSINQMMVAVYRANPAAFDGNMNLLRAGAILQIPDADTAGRIAAGEATAEVAQQTAAWQGSTPAAAAPAEQQARLRLVPPSGDGAAGGAGSGDAASSAAVEELEDQVQSLQSELDESRRLIELQNQQLQALQQQLADSSAPPPADALPSDPGVELESGADPAAESEPLFADEAEPETSEPAPAPAAEPPGEAPPAAAPPPAAASEPSLMSRVLGWLANPLVWIVLGVAAVLVAGFGYLRSRRGELDDVTGRWEAFEADVDADETSTRGGLASTAQLRKPVDRGDADFVVEESPSRPAETLNELDADVAAAAWGESESRAETPAPPAPRSAPAEDTLSSQTVINLDQADPIAEADFHMAYGLYDQAAELMTKALDAHPGNRAFTLKLLEVYFVWGNRDAFLETARRLRGDIGDGPDSDWDKVMIMGKQICPDEDLFAGAPASAGEIDVDLAGGDSPDLDLSFGDGTDGDIDLDLGGDDDELDLSLEATGESQSRHAGASSDDDDMLEIGAQTSAGLEAALFEDDDDGEGPTGAHTSPDVGGAWDSLEDTQESPTVETETSHGDYDDWNVATTESPTLESPTVEQSGFGGDADNDDRGEDEYDPGAATGLMQGFDADSPTVESPTVEQSAFGGDDDDAEDSADATGLLEGFDVDADPADDDSAGASTAEQALESELSELPTVEQPKLDGSGEYTAELDLDDLGLDVTDFDGLPGDLGDVAAAPDAESDTREQPALDQDDDELLSATGVTQVLSDDDGDLDELHASALDDDAATMMAPGLGDDTHRARTEVLEQAVDEPDDGAGQLADTGLDLDFGELSGALDDGGDTVEQPHARGFDSADVFGADDGTPIDLDVGSDATGDDDPTGTEDYGPLDAQTMTEVGTKLDLARAYIDMGDPEGARSILEEVLDEGDTGQKREAQSLIDTLNG